MAREEYSLSDVCFNSHSEHFDPVAFDLFEKGVLQDDHDKYDDLVEYLDYYYDIDFEVDFWDEYYPPS